MKLRIDINMENAAFDDDPAEEVRRILHEINGRLARGEFAEIFEHGGKHKLFDINGNRCGQLTFSGRG
jgi:hypothetical protein